MAVAAVGQVIPGANLKMMSLEATQSRATAGTGEVIRNAFFANFWVARILDAVKRICRAFTCRFWQEMTEMIRGCHCVAGG
jgi:hypothetical protein